MSRTYKSTGHIEIDEDDGTRYYQKPSMHTWKHGINMSKILYQAGFWPEDGYYGQRIPHANRTKDAFYESCHHQAKNWERTRYDTERADAIAMDKEWRRAQWKAQMKE